MDKHKENGILLVQNKVIKCRMGNDVEKYSYNNSVPADSKSTSEKRQQEEAEALEKESELYNTVYKEISEIIGLDATLKIYLRFKGQQISFPVRLYNPHLIQQNVIKEFDGTNIKALAKKYDYSEKTIRRMIRDSVEDSDSDDSGYYDD